MTSDRIRVTVDFITRRLSLIRALYIVSIAANGPNDEIKEEFHRAVGDVLEGRTLAEIQLTYIDKQTVMQEVAWLHEHP